MNLGAISTVPPALRGCLEFLNLVQADEAKASNRMGVGGRDSVKNHPDACHLFIEMAKHLGYQRKLHK